MAEKKKTNVWMIILIMAGVATFALLIYFFATSILSGEFLHFDKKLNKVWMFIIPVAILIGVLFILPFFIKTYNNIFPIVYKSYWVNKEYDMNDFDDDPVEPTGINYIPYVNEIAIMDLPQRIAQIIGIALIVIYFLILSLHTKALVTVFGGHAFWVLNHDFYLLVLGILIVIISKGIFYGKVFYFINSYFANSDKDDKGIRPMGMATVIGVYVGNFIPALRLFSLVYMSNQLNAVYIDYLDKDTEEEFK